MTTPSTAVTGTAVTTPSTAVTGTALTAPSGASAVHRPDVPARLVHTGNVVVDVVMYLPRLPESGGDVLASESRITAGGGLNVMVGAARQGLTVAYAGRHGTGPFADLARRQLAEAGVEVIQPPSPEIDTGFSVAMVDPSGERTFATSLGAEAQLAPADLARIVTRPGDIVYVSGYSLAYPSNGAALAEWLPTLGPEVTVIVDPGPLVSEIPAPVLASALARADWWSCNEREARLLTGHADPTVAATALANRTGRAGVLVRTGPDGAVLVLAGGGGPVVVPAFRVEVVDTNGAGDAHVGAFAAALARGLDPVEAVRRANAAAAFAVTRRGPATAPTTTELNSLLG
ncbi:sugar/nucleoside kinase (ribokinase family) [Micromonospora pisi]|uniref:Sugar/nucleoside kinase (Ribokinase family) n=1 Tax=Micromonospora pisi TaxID=589240 RepID=A0A495JND2_9ACTN|nr:PfkB family carbohydrate kinase [Micromonospora pisi]RKR90443.1 sugar/nucleoside kinase (ribokinase family) [Micromonospora pisi]